MGSTTPANTQNKEDLSSGVKKENRGASTSGAGDKLKASNFPALLLRIGSWEVYSCYYFWEDNFVIQFSMAESYVSCSINLNTRVTW